MKHMGSSALSNFNQQNLTKGMEMLDAVKAAKLDMAKVLEQVKQLAQTGQVIDDDHLLSIVASCVREE